MKIAESFFSKQRSCRFWRWSCFSVLGVMTVTVSAKPLGEDVSIWVRRDWGGEKLCWTLLSHCWFATRMSEMRAAPALFTPPQLTPGTSTILEQILSGKLHAGKCQPLGIVEEKGIVALRVLSSPFSQVSAGTHWSPVFCVQCWAQPGGFHIFFLPLCDSK